MLRAIIFLLALTGAVLGTTITEPQTNRDGLYSGFIPIELQSNGIFIEDLYVIPALYRLENFILVEDILKKQATQISIEQSIISNQATEISLRKVNEELLKNSLSTTENYWKSKNAKDSAIWFGVGSGAGALLVLILYGIISSSK